MVRQVVLGRRVVAPDRAGIAFEHLVRDPHPVAGLKSRSGRIAASSGSGSTNSGSGGRVCLRSAEHILDRADDARIVEMRALPSSRGTSHPYGP